MTSLSKKVALGMSGGVDSSLSAYLLKEAGYEVTGVYLECWRAPGCRTEEDRKDALAVALELNIPFQVLDFKDAYKNRVVEYFFDEYQAGRTPNPDVMCNKEIKFGLFYGWAMAHGFEYVATGHYAQVLPIGEAGKLALSCSVDAHKDQTYFLYRMRTEQLAHILFPVGHLTKPEVRAAATQRHIAVASKKDSVGICFIGDINVHEFLRERLGENPGPVVDTQGNVIGEHEGLWFYTVGQRHGFTIFPKTVQRLATGEEIDKHNVPPFYVIAKRAKTNELMVGFGAQTYTQDFTVVDLHWIDKLTAAHTATELLVRIRHTGELLPATLIPGKDSKPATVHLHQAVQGVAEGQSAVFYQGHADQTICLGGGVISMAEAEATGK
jgi:tRNA-specific 2-thiouridylase